jgi:DNA (cytosine-5)-methyltransferase 1
VVFGEQVPVAIKHGWFDLVATELESEAYAFAATVSSACEFGAPLDGQRIYFVAKAGGQGMAGPIESLRPSLAGQWEWAGETDLRAVVNAPFEPGHSWPAPLFRSMDARIPGRVGRMRAYGNAIVPQVAAQVIAAFMDAS